MADPDPTTPPSVEEHFRNEPRKLPDPKPERPRPQRPPVAMSLLGPLLAGFAGNQGSLRRYVLGFGTAAVLMLNHKLGLGLALEEQALIAGLVTTIVLASNTKEAAVQRARVRAEADVVKTQVNAAAGRREQ